MILCLTGVQQGTVDASQLVRPGMKVSEITALGDSDAASLPTEKSKAGLDRLLGIAGAAITLGLAGLGLAFVFRRRWRRLESPAPGIRVVARAALSPKHFVVVVETGGRRLTIGLSGEHMTVLAADGLETVEDVASRSSEGMTSSGAAEGAVVERSATDTVDPRGERIPENDECRVRRAVTPESPTASDSRSARAEVPRRDPLSRDGMESRDDIEPRDGFASRDSIAREISDTARVFSPSADDAVFKRRSSGHGHGLFDAVPEPESVPWQARPLRREDVEPYQRQVDRLRRLLESWDPTQPQEDWQEGCAEE